MLIDQDKLAARILADRAPRPEPTRHNIQQCIVCERSYITGDGRFCSPNCRSVFDDGFPAAVSNADPVPNLHWHAGWRVVAGPPGLEVGALYYKDERFHRSGGKTGA